MRIYYSAHIRVDQLFNRNFELAKNTFLVHGTNVALSKDSTRTTNCQREDSNADSLRPERLFMDEYAAA